MPEEAGGDAVLVTCTKTMFKGYDGDKTMLGRLMASRWLMTVLVTAGGLVSTASKAEVILYNNWQSQAGQQQFQGTGNWFSQSFTTGSTAANLNTVSVMVRNESGSSGTIGVEIYSSTAGNLPNTSLYTISAGATIPAFYDSNSGDSPTGVKESFFHNLNFDLDPSTQYFVVVKNLSTANIGIKYPNQLPVTDVSPTPTYYDLITNNSGGSWSNGAPSTGGYGVYVTVTAVPEPSMFAALGTAGTIAGYLRLRRQKRPQRMA